MKPDFFLFVAPVINYNHHFLRGKTHVAFSPLQGAPRPTFVTCLAQTNYVFKGIKSRAKCSRRLSLPLQKRTSVLHYSRAIYIIKLFTIGGLNIRQHLLSESR